MRMRETIPHIRLTEVEDKVCAFLVWNTAVRFIWIISFIEANHQSLIFWPVFILFQGIVERLGTDDKCETAFCWGVKNLLEDTFNIRCPAFVEPEVRGICVAVDVLMVRFASRGETCSLT
jgi:hypothetical protein